MFSAAYDAQQRLLQALTLCMLVAQVVRADLPFRLSHSKQCAPLNITWTPVAANYPYTVTIGAIGNGVESFRIPSSYQPDMPELTFQYVVPPATALYNSFIVVVTDAVGNGNSSRIIGIDVRAGDTSCDPYVERLAFLWAGDSQVQSITNMVQCGEVKFYPVDTRGKAPFSITLIPLGGVPRTFNVPATSTPRDNFFNYTMKVPFEAGTQFYTMLSDAHGTGSGGGSPIYTVGQSNDASCIGVPLPGEVRNLAIPTGSMLATFKGLPGAVTEAQANADARGGNSGGPSAGTIVRGGSGSGSGGSGSGGSGTGGPGGVQKKDSGLLEGGIGAGVGLSVVISALVGWYMLRRRRRIQREIARKEEPTFVDLDDDGQDGTTTGLVGRRGRPSRGVSQSYTVSPYTHASAGSSPTVQQTSSRPNLTAIDTGSTYGYALGSRPASMASNAPPVTPSAVHYAPGTRPPSSAGPDTRYPPGSSRPRSSSGMTDTHQGSAAYTHLTSEDQYASPVSHSGPGSAGHGGYRLAARNGEVSPDVPPVPHLPIKRPLPTRPNTGDSRRSQRVVQHSDAGPLPAPGSDDGHEEAVVELPPSYAPGWSDRNPHAA